MAGEQKPKRGRPKKDPAKVKRNNVTIAMADPIRRAIGEAAERSGRSLSSEIDFRLGMSLALDQDTGSPTVRRLLDFTRLAAMKLEEDYGEDWTKSDKVASGLTSAITSYIFSNSPRPAGLEEWPLEDVLIERLLARINDEALLAELRDEIARWREERNAAMPNRYDEYRRSDNITRPLSDLFRIKED